MMYKILEFIRNNPEITCTTEEFVQQFYATTTLANSFESYKGNRTVFAKWNQEISKWLNTRITTLGEAGKLHEFLKNLFTTTGSIEAWNKVNGTNQVREQYLKHCNKLKEIIAPIARYDRRERARIEKAIMNLFSNPADGLIEVSILDAGKKKGEFRIKDNNIIIRLYDRNSNSERSGDTWRVDYRLTIIDKNFKDEPTKVKRVQALGFKSPEEVFKAINYYIKIGRIKLEAGTYTYNLFNGFSGQQDNKRVYDVVRSNGDMLTMRNDNEPYLKPGEVISKNNSVKNSYLENGQYIYYRSILIKGGLHEIHFSTNDFWLGKHTLKTRINSINDVQTSLYDTYFGYMIYFDEYMSQTWNTFTFTPNANS